MGVGCRPVLLGEKVNLKTVPFDTQYYEARDQMALKWLKTGIVYLGILYCV